MPKKVQIRRGTTVEHATFRGGIGEVTMNTNTKRLHVHDASTYGGHPLALEAEVAKKGENLADLVNASEARSNLGVFSKDESFNVNKSRQYANAAYFGGLYTLQRIYGALGTYSIGTQPFTLRLQFRVPESNGAGVHRAVAFLGANNNSASGACFSVLVESDKLQIRIYGATTADYFHLEYWNLIPNFGGQLIELTLVRSLTDLKAYINGVPIVFDFSASTAGGATVLSSITSSFLVVGAGIQSPFIGEVYGATLFNYPLDADQVASLNREGVAAADLWADDVEMILAAADRDFSAASNWANSSMTTYDETGDLSVSATVADEKAALGAGYVTGPSPGRRYQLACDVSGLTGGTFRLNGKGSIINDLTPVPIGTISANGRFYATFLMDTGTFFGDLQLLSDAAGSVNLDNITFKPAGAVLDWNFNDAVTYQVPDRSTNGYHGTVADGPTFLYSGRSGCIRGRTNTLGNQQLLGATCLAANARIRSVHVTSDNSGTPVTVVNLGTSSGSSAIAAGIAVSSGRNEVATFTTRFTTNGNIWVNADGNSNLDWTIFFDLVD